MEIDRAKPRPLTSDKTRKFRAANSLYCFIKILCGSCYSIGSDLSIDLVLNRNMLRTMTSPPAFLAKNINTEIELRKIG